MLHTLRQTVLKTSTKYQILNLHVTHAVNPSDLCDIA